ncbi:hypothetical protein D3C76_914130 [compost metagenome]
MPEGLNGWLARHAITGPEAPGWIAYEFPPCASQNRPHPLHVPSFPTVVLRLRLEFSSRVEAGIADRDRLSAFAADDQRAAIGLFPRSWSSWHCERDRSCVIHQTWTPIYQINRLMSRQVKLPPAARSRTQIPVPKCQVVVPSGQLGSHRSS